VICSPCGVLRHNSHHGSNMRKKNKRHSARASIQKLEIEHGRHALFIKLCALFGVPLEIEYIVLLVLLVLQPKSCRGYLDFLELMAGAHACTNSARQRNLAAFPYDILYDPVAMDFDSDTGFLHGLDLAIGHLKFASQAVAGIVCSSFGFVNRGTSKRALYDPLGVKTYKILPCPPTANHYITKPTSASNNCNALPK
jgi:hypothetical protein